MDQIQLANLPGMIHNIEYYKIRRDLHYRAEYHWDVSITPHISWGYG